MALSLRAAKWSALRSTAVTSVVGRRACHQAHTLCPRRQHTSSVGFCRAPRMSFTTTAAAPAAAAGPPHRFHTFDVTSQVFLERTHTLGVVNLKPIVPLHVLLITRKPYARLAEVPQDAVHELFDVVQEVSTVVQRLTGATSCTVAIQDGKEAGQSVPHLHVHILPRRKGDITPNDAIYAHLDAFGMSLHSDLLQRQQEGAHANDDGDSSGLAVDASEHRKPRTAEQMACEATWLREQL